MDGLFICSSNFHVFSKFGDKTRDCFTVTNKRDMRFTDKMRGAIGFYIQPWGLVLGAVAGLSA